MTDLNPQPLPPGRVRINVTSEVAYDLMLEYQAPETPGIRGVTLGCLPPEPPDLIDRNFDQPPQRPGRNGVVAQPKHPQSGRQGIGGEYIGAAEAPPEPL